MELDDLRKGNLVMWMGEIACISQILEVEVVFKCGDIGLISDLQPIPITTDILLEFGYKKYGCHYCIQGHKIWLCNDLFVCDKNGTVLKYVHKLQNLYYAINNLELTRKKI